jgi:hypothetical protein
MVLENELNKVGRLTLGFPDVFAVIEQVFQVLPEGGTRAAALVLHRMGGRACTRELGDAGVCARCHIKVPAHLDFAEAQALLHLRDHGVILICGRNAR